MIKRAVCWTLVISLHCLPGMLAADESIPDPTDEIDAALEIEEGVEEGLETGIEVDRVTAAEMQPPPLVAALQAKTQELENAQKEIHRLKQYILRIREANRREKAIMYYNMGCVYRAGKLFEKAEEAFLKALEYDSMLADAHYNLAVLYDDDMEDREKAKGYYEMFLKLSPDDAVSAQVVEWLASLKPKPSGL